ncbi:MAG TPA: DUF3368 domain-containing protein [Pseudomonadales bacterium]|nr:DUF3368 domain-containing protein [Pseudomonadales bacterium]
MRYGSRSSVIGRWLFSTLTSCCRDARHPIRSGSIRWECFTHWHSGEYAALCQCLAAPRALLLTDDTAARLAAAALAISAHGTIGIVVRAMRRGQMDKAQTLAALKEIPQRTSLHIRRNLLAEIIQQVEAFPEPDARDGA